MVDKMADLLIKGMKMPTNCPCELLGTGYDLYCSFALGIPARVKEYYECCQNNKRPSWCPLVSVPPHGRLIDADELLNDVRKNSESYFADDFAHEWVDRQPTVIETSEEE